MGCGASTNDNSENAYVSKPQNINRYIRKQLLGKGTYGQVYRCIDTNDNQEYAMKVVKISSKTRDKAAVQIGQLKSQISMLKKLNHPFIVKYRSFDVSSSLDQVEIVMELVKVGTLREYIDKNGPLNEKLCAEIAAKILEALFYLHGQNIIHRDLKCANVLLTQDLIPKLSDFGTAKVIPKVDNDDIAKLSASLKGTPYFMAPEVLKRSGHNHSADIWSFGCMVIEMLSGKVPWTNHSAKFSEIIGYISSGIPPPYPPGLSKQCEFFLASCLDPVPSKRLQAHELLKHRFINRNSLSSKKQINMENSLKQKSNKKKNSPLSNKDQHLKSQNKALSRNTLLDISVEDIEDYYENDEYPSMRKNTEDLNRNNHYDSFVKKTESHRRKISDRKSTKKGTSKIIQQIHELDRLQAEMNEVSISDEEIPEGKYYVKKTLANLKKNKQSKGISKTSTALKNTQANLQSVDNSIQLRSNTEMSYEEEAINTMISRAERGRYLEEKKIFSKQRDEDKRKWEEELKQGAAILKKQFSSRYVIPQV